MIAAVRAEVLKLTTTRLWWVLALILAGYVGFTAALLAGLFGALGDQLATQPNAPQLPPRLIPPVVYSTVTAVGYVFPLILGTLAVTSEVRYQTLTPTFLAEPKRGRVLTAKLLVLAAAGAVYGVVGLIVSMGLGAPILAATGTDSALGDSDTWALAGRVVLAMALWAVIGVGIGSLIQNQIAAVIVVLAFTQFVEPILRFGTTIWEWTAQIGRFLPGAASDALVGSSIFTSLSTGGVAVEPLQWWQGGLVLLAIALVVALIGYLTAWRRDVT
ncbi:ABC transporter permease [soil metagenome]